MENKKSSQNAAFFEAFESVKAQNRLAVEVQVRDLSDAEFLDYLKGLKNTDLKQFIGEDDA